jgi:ACS family hexuronate transporter-like MFS transporter
LADVAEWREQRTVTAPAQYQDRRRWLILSLLFAITVINVIDRQTLSVLAPTIRAFFNLTNTEYGRIVAALQFGMMAGEFPMGSLMDSVGTRLGLALAVGWWSAATGAQVFTRSGLQLGFTRFWMGTGECGNFSGGVKTVTRLFHKKDRTLAIGIFNSGTIIGATVAIPLIVYLMKRFGFRAAFIVPAVLGLLWLPFWLWSYKREAKRTAAEAAETNISLGNMLSRSSSWAVMLCRGLIGPTQQFYWYWIPSYLISSRHMTLTEMGFVGWIPFFFGGVGGVLGGVAAGILHNRGMRVSSMRRWLMYLSALGCAASFLVPYSSSVMGVILWLSLALTAGNFLSANMYGAVTDLFPEKEVGRATGLTGVASGFSGFVFPLLTGILVDRISYTPVFVLVALMPLVGVIFLFVLGRTGYRRLDATDAAAAA